MRIDIGADDEGDDVEKGDPCLFGQELLRKGQCERGGDPADFHDGHEACFHRCAHLMVGPCAGDEGHGG